MFLDWDLYKSLYSFSLAHNVLEQFNHSGQNGSTFGSALTILRRLQSTFRGGQLIDISTKIVMAINRLTATSSAGLSVRAARCVNFSRPQVAPAFKLPPAFKTPAEGSALDHIALTYHDVINSYIY